MNKIWYGEIYKIENLVNGKVYIGQTTIGFNKRYGTTENNKKDPIEIVYNYHKNKIEYGCNIHLLRSIEKYGFESFVVNKIIDVAFSQEELDIKECMYIKLYNSINNGYNHKEGGIDGKRKTSFFKRLMDAYIKDHFILYDNNVYFSSYHLKKEIKYIDTKLIKHAYSSKVLIDIDNLKLYYCCEDTYKKFNMSEKEFLNMCKRKNNKKYNIKFIRNLSDEDCCNLRHNQRYERIQVN